MAWLMRIYEAIFGGIRNRTAIEHRDSTSSSSSSSSNSEVSEDESPAKMSAPVELSRHAAFPADSLPEAVSATIDENGKIIAKQTLVKFSANQAYCVVSEFDSRLVDREVRVSEDKEKPCELKLLAIEEEKIKKHLLPIFVRFHHPLKQRSAESHLSDRSFEQTLGRFNLELKKNVTMDTFERIDSWRDEAGFIVTDRNQYELATFAAKDILQEVVPADAAVSSYIAADLDAVLDFDHSVCGANRQSLIEQLAKETQLYLIKTATEVNGLIAGKGERIFALYAETIELAHTLIKHYVEQNNIDKVTFFTRTEVWQCPPLSTRPVFRYHTRSVPAQLKWNKVYVANMGVHLV